MYDTSCSSKQVYTHIDKIVQIIYIISTKKRYKEFDIFHTHIARITLFFSILLFSFLFLNKNVHI